ncbi:MAG: hypothetical protein NXI31_19585 [bacterium]|nr:hypothetical protein [bacterium]
MSAAPQDFCTRTNAVLALYLDGDIDGAGRGFDPEAFEDSGFELVCPETLANHLRECEICQVALQRARRLDAALAESAGRSAGCISGSITQSELVDEAADRLLDEAIARVAAEADEFGLEIDLDADLEVGGDGIATANRENARQHAVLVPALLLTLAVGGLIGLWLVAGDRELPVTSADAADADTVNRPADDMAAAGTTESATTGARVAGDSVDRDQPPAASEAGVDIDETQGEIGQIKIAQIEIAQSAGRRLRARIANRRDSDPNALADASPVALAGRMLDEELLPRERIRAATVLFESSRPGASGNSATLGFVIDTLAAGHAEPRALADAFLLLRREAHVLGYLRTTLRRIAVTAPTTPPGGIADADASGLSRRETAALVVATRIGADEAGDRGLDELIRRVVRRHPSAIDLVTAALRPHVRPTGGAGLLLDCWGDLARRHDIDEAAMARHLFAAQPRQRFTEVESELDSARSVHRRVRCLLALASSPDRQCVSRLLRWATASCRHEAYAAAWSLSQLPHNWLDAAARRAARDPGAFVLRAALARAGVPAAIHWTKPMRLTAAERTVIGRARYELFPRLAEWFRDGPRRRSAIADD